MAEPSPLNDNDGEEADEGQQVFVRVINTRPGAPWDQSRQAVLEARLGAPSRLADVVYRVRRLEPWRPARTARFAAVYARAEDTREGLRATPTIDGRPVAISFVPPAAQARRLRDAALLGGALAAAIALALLLVTNVASRRAQTDDMLTQAEAVSAARLGQIQRLDGMQGQSRILDQLNLKDQRLSEVLAEIDWASGARSPAAHIQALHWDHGFLAVEADGDRPPIEKLDRPMQRSRQPVRPGVWLWGLPSTEPWAAGLDRFAAPTKDMERPR